MGSMIQGKPIATLSTPASPSDVSCCGQAGNLEATCWDPSHKAGPHFVIYSLDLASSSVRGVIVVTCFLAAYPPSLPGHWAFDPRPPWHLVLSVGWGWSGVRSRGDFPRSLPAATGTTPKRMRWREAVTGELEEGRDLLKLPLRAGARPAGPHNLENTAE